MRKTILLPTDFSDNAWTAAQYAAHMAQKFSWDIHIIHVVNAYNSVLAGRQFSDSIEATSTDKAREQLEDIHQKLKLEFPDLHIHTALVNGRFSELILNLIRQNNYNLVVMGTKGAGAIKGSMIGSNTFEIIQKSPIGVIAVPEDYTNFKLHTIGMLTNFKENEVLLLNSFINRVNTPLALVLLHAKEARKNTNSADIEFIRSKYAKITQLEEVDYMEDDIVNRLDYNSPIPKCIERMVERKAIDLLLVSYNRKSFFRQLFSRSLTKSLAHNIKVPTYFKHNEG